MSFFPLTIVPGLKSKAPYWATFPLVVKNCVSKALGFSSARMLILERILWKGRETTSANTTRLSTWWQRLQKIKTHTEEMFLHLTGVRRGGVLPRRQSPWLAGYWLSLLAADQPQRWENTLGVSTQRSTHYANNYSITQILTLVTMEQAVKQLNNWSPPTL